MASLHFGRGIQAGSASCLNLNCFATPAAFAQCVSFSDQYLASATIVLGVGQVNAFVPGGLRWAAH